jgi:hypothetical protein
MVTGINQRFLTEAILPARTNGAAAAPSLARSLAQQPVIALLPEQPICLFSAMHTALNVSTHQPQHRVLLEQASKL